MPFDDINDYYKMVLSYLHDASTIKPLPKGHSCYPLITDKTKLIRKAIKDSWKTLPIERKVEIINIIDKAIWESKKQYANKVNELKKSLGKGNNWKDALLAVDCEKLQDRKFALISYDADASKSYKSTFENALCQNTFSIIGSCFKTNVQRHLANNQGKGHCLDALYVTRSKENHSMTFALGDGAGGHFGDDVQDKSIARAAHFATKAAVRFLNTITTPEGFMQNYKWFVKAIAQEVQTKVKHEGTTLVVGRTFFTQNQYRCVGFTIGDSLCFAWDPIAKQCISVAPAHVISQGSAAFPTIYKDHEVHIFDVILPPGCILFAISDGIYDHLPCIQQAKKYPDDIDFTETMLDGNFITQLFHEVPVDAQPAIYADALNKSVMEKMEQLRLQKVAASTNAQQRRQAVEAELKRQEETVDRDNKEDLRRIHKPLDDLMADLDIQIGDDMAISAIALIPPQHQKKIDTSPRSTSSLKPF
jgi:hypothetical protein